MADTYTNRPLALVTGASSGIGLALAGECARNGYDLVVAADQPLREAMASLRAAGARVEGVETDLATVDGVAKLHAALAGRVPDALLANAGHGLGHAFLDQDFAAIRHVIDTNITGTVDLIHRVAGAMRRRGHGRILITGSIAGFLPGSFQAVYNASKAFIDSFSWALRNELKDSGVSVTCLMPGPTDTEFFERAGLEDTRVGADATKDDPEDVARVGFRAMQDGEGDVVSGFRNKLQVALAQVTPSGLLAERHRQMAEPGSARHRDS
jgi:uncharacterized protein